MKETDARKPSPRKPDAPPSVAAVAAPSRGPIEVAGIGPSSEPPCVAASGAWIGHLGAGQLTVWDLKKRSRIESIPLRTPRGLAAIPSGSLVALHEPELGRYEFLVLQAGKPRQRFPVALTLDPFGERLVRVLPDPRTADELLIVGEQGAVGYQLALLAGTLRRRYSYTLAPQEAATATLAADGALWFFRPPGFGRMLSETDTPTAVAAPDLHEAIWHLVPGPSAADLYATVGPNRVARIHIAGGIARVVRTHEQGPGVVHALASSAQHVAALVVEPAASRPPRFTAVVYSHDGSQAMRAAVPDLAARGAKTAISIALAPSGYVAIASASELRIFEISTGKLVLSDGGAAGPID